MTLRSIWQALVEVIQRIFGFFVDVWVFIIDFPLVKVLQFVVACFFIGITLIFIIKYLVKPMWKYLDKKLGNGPNRPLIVSIMFFGLVITMMLIIKLAMIY